MEATDSMLGNRALAALAGTVRVSQAGLCQWESAASIQRPVTNYILAAALGIYLRTIIKPTYADTAHYIEPAALPSVRVAMGLQNATATRLKAHTN
jgi:hypothetical protein